MQCTCSANAVGQPTAARRSQNCSAAGRCFQVAAARTHLWRLGWVVFCELHGQGIEAPLPQRALLAGDETLPLHEIGLTAGGGSGPATVRQAAGPQRRWAGGRGGSGSGKHSAALPRPGAHPLSVVSGRAWKPKGLYCRARPGRRVTFSGHHLKTQGLQKPILRGTAPFSMLAAPLPACCALLPPCCTVSPPDRRSGRRLYVCSRAHTNQ